MKYLFLLFNFLFASTVKQDAQFIVFFREQSVALTLEDDNTDKVIKIDLQQLSKENSALVVKSNIWKSEKDWKRHFIIFDETDNEAAHLTASDKNGIFCLPAKEISKSLKSGKIYFLYTTLIPKDPEKAMGIRVKRQLMCEIVIE